MARLIIPTIATVLSLVVIGVLSWQDISHRDAKTSISESSFVPLVRPAFAQTGSFLDQEAGIAAYVKLQNQVQLESAKQDFKIVEQDTSDLVVSIVEIVNAPLNPHVFVSSDGWVVAYFLRDESIGNAWAYSHGFKPPDDVVVRALSQVSSTVGGAPAYISYFDFEYPGANRISVINAPTNGDPFEVQIPNDFQVFEAAETGYYSGVEDVTPSIQIGQFQEWYGALIVVYRDLSAPAQFNPQSANRIAVRGAENVWRSLLGAPTQFGVHPAGSTPTPSPTPTSTLAPTLEPNSGNPDGPVPPPSALAAIDRELARFEKANIVFNAPDTLQLGESSTIQLLLSTEKSISELQGELDNVQGPTEGADVKISAVMRARLTGSGFLIEQITEEIQLVSGSENTEWRWEIIPKRTGAQRLHLSLSALISVEGSERRRSVKTFDQDIEVRVDKILKPLKEAKMTFDSPNAVRLGKPLPVELLVSPQVPVGIANRMNAMLTGSGFVIQPITTEIQSVSEMAQTKWQWEIVPVKTGSQSLHMALSAVIYIADDPTPQKILVNDYRYELEVRATWGERVSSFIANNWQWLWAAILVPMRAFLLPIVRKLFSKFVLKRR